MSMYSHFALQHVTNISAHTYADLESAPLILSFEGDNYEHGHAEITIHTRNAELSLALADAINNAVASVRAKRDAIEIAA